jgi:hypothetical protein
LNAPPKSSYPQGSPQTPLQDYLTSTSSNLIANRRDKEPLIDSIISTHSDIIEPGWERRHGKLITLKGVVFYEQLAFKARKYGRNPKALMGSLVNQALSK